MKKRIKLLSTIAALCVSIATLCFGVFAASQVSFTATGSVTYEVNDVFASITTQSVQYVQNLRRGFEDADAITEQAADEDNVWVDVALNEGETLADNFSTDTQLDPTASGEVVGEFPEFDFNTSCLYRVVITVHLYKQQSPIDVTASIGQNPANGADQKLNTHWIMVSDTETMTSIDASAAEQDIELTFYMALEDVTTAAAGDFVISIVVAQAA